MRRFAKTCLSVVLAALLILSSETMSVIACAETAPKDVNNIESADSQAKEIPSAGDAGTRTLPRVLSNDVDPNAHIDKNLEDGIREISTVDKSTFINSDEINVIHTDYIPARFDTMTRNGSYAGTAHWSSNHENGWVVGAGRYTWMQVDVSDTVKKILEQPGNENYNLVQANINVTNKYSRTAGDTNYVRYIPNNSWTSATDSDAGGKALTYNNSQSYFDEGIDIGSGKVSGSSSAMKTSTLPVDGLSRFGIGDDYLVSLVIYGGGTGADIASLDLTEANNYNQPLIDGYEPSLQLVYSNATQAQIEYEIDRPYALDKIQEIIEVYDGSEVAASFTPLGDENDVMVTYSVNDEASRQWVEADGGKIKVNRPTAEQGNQDVIITVTAQRNNAIFVYDLKITVMAQQGAAPTVEKSLQSVIEFAEKTLAEQEAANNIVADGKNGKPGQLSQAKASAFADAIANAKACTDVNQMSNMTKVLIAKGQEFMGSGIISNEILYRSPNKYLDSGNTLVYSEARAKLQALVWKAKATLLVDTAMYPKSAQKALQVEIDRAETALEVDEDGTSMLKLPFTKTRMFYAGRDDEMIEYATSYSTMFHNYSGGIYGLEPVLNWYSTENILYNAYSTVEVEPTFMGYIQNANKDNWNGGNIVIGKAPDDRIGMFQFDLSGVEGAIQSAQIRLVADNTNSHPCTIYLEDDDYTNNQPTWNQMVKKNGAYQSAGVGVVSGKAIGTYKPAGKDNDSYGNVTDAAIAEAAGDGVLTFSIQINAPQTYANDLYCTNNASKVTQLPIMIVKTADVSRSSLQTTANNLIDNQKALLESAATYSGNVKDANVGEFSKSTHDAAMAAMKNLENKLKGNDTYEVAEAAVKFLDTAYECRMSIALLSDIDVDEEGNQKGNIFYSEEDIQELKERVKTNDNIKKAYQDIKDAMKSVSLEASQDYWERWRINDKSLWEENVAFATPPASTGGKYSSGRHVNNESGKELPANLPSGHTYTGKAYITIELQSGDNDTTGYSDMSKNSHCGEAWIDNLTITSDDGNDVEIPNASFETKAISENAPLNWTLITTGNGEGRWESNRANVSSGNRSLYLHNPDGNSSVTWKSSVFDLPILSSTDGFDVTFAVKQYGIFEDKGVQVKFHFLTETAAGESEVVSRPNYYNAKGKPSVTGVGSYTIVMQRAAILAMLTDNDVERDKYAKIAKTYIYLYVDEINQGIENWIITGGRPDGIDAYGAVQAGRGAGSMATAYSIIKNMKDKDGNPILSDEEKAELTESAYYLIRDLNDIRDRYELNYEETAKGGSNWSSDMNMGAAMLGLAFEDTMTDARAHFYTGMRIDEAMLLVNIREDGSWPESVRYHNAAVSKLAVLAKCLRSSTSFDWFANKELNFYRSFDYLTWIQTPRYANGNASTPFFGDHNLSSGDELYMCGLYYDEIAESHPEVALRMYATWVNAGTPAPSLSGDDNQLQVLFGHTIDINDYGNYEDSLKDIGSTDYAKYFGMYIMRNNFMAKGTESYLVTMIQNKETGHNHRDQLSFIMYADNVPLVIDPGSSPSYWGGAKSNYIGNTQHSLVAYAKDNSRENYEDTDVISTLRGFYMSDSLDMSKASTNHRTGTGELKRDIAFIKNGFEAYVVWDQVTGADYGTMMNLPLYTNKKDAITHDGNKFTAKMFGGIDLEITYLEGNYESYEVVTLNANGSYQKREDEDNPKVDHLRIRNEGNDGYLTVLFPKTSKRGNLTTENLGNGVYKLSHSSGNSVYLAVNEGKTAKTVSLPEKNLYDLESLDDNNNAAVVYEDGVVTIPQYSMKLLTTKVTTTQAVAEAGTGASTTIPAVPQQGSTIGSSTSGANAGGGGGAAAPSNDATNYIFGNNSTTDLTVPGVIGSPAASINEAKAEAGKLVFNVTDNNDVYYSLNGSVYQKYDGSISLPVEMNNITYFTVDLRTGAKTRAISKTVTVMSTVGSNDVVLADADTAVNVYRNIVTGQKGKILLKEKDGISVFFKTSNSKIATVSSKGVITTKKKGKVVISVLVSKNATTEKVLLNLTVKDKAKVPTVVRKLGNVRTTKAGTPVITISKNIKLSGTSKIVVEKKDGVTLSYKSSDKNVVTVSKNGKITGKSVGTANVIVNVKYNGVVQKYQVKVTVK